MLRSAVVNLLFAATVVVGGCGRTGLAIGGAGGGVTCGPGTHLVGTECLPGGSGGANGGGGGDGTGGGGGSGTGAGGGGGGDGGGSGDGGVSGDMSPPPQGDRATSWQIDPAHSGGQPNTRLRPPLARLWSWDAGGSLSYPLVSDGRVFVTSAIGGANGSRVTALASGTGGVVWGPIALGGAYAGIATSSYDVSLTRLFVMNGDGLVSALDPATGRAYWTKQLGAFAGEIGPLVSQAGLLFVPQEWNLVVLDGKSGATRWMGAAGASPMATAVTPFGVYTCAVGGYVSANDPASGVALWQHAGSGDGGGGCYTVLGGGRLYAYDWADPPLVLDPSTGSVDGAFSGPVAPAVDGDRAYFLIGKNLEAHDANNTVLWTFAGDGTLDTQPIAGGGYVYVGGSSGMLYAVDETGQVAFSDLLPSPLGAATDYVSSSGSGFAIAEDKLFVSAGTSLYAYASR
jgi:outer membrane protein assembly factor BamB